MNVVARGSKEGFGAPQPSRASEADFGGEFILLAGVDACAPPECKIDGRSTFGRVSTESGAPSTGSYVAVGTDNLLRSENRRHVTLRFTVTNLTNKAALYNFLSTFSGTHFVPPRAYQAAVGYTF